MSRRQSQADIEAAILDDLAEFYDDPLGYVMYAFPWDSYEPIQLVELPAKYQKKYNCVYGPDKWALEFLEEWGREIRKRNFNGRDAVDPIRFATSSGHGIGKSTISAWIIKFIMDTRPFCKGTVTANTSDQLKAKTWAELGKWHSISITRDMYKYTSGRGAMSLAHRDHAKTWFVTGQTCREENSEAFAGQHAASSTSFYLFDEASAIPDKIYEVREGGLTDGEPMVFDFGNPTRRSGQFFEECEGKLKHLYKVRKIDSRDVAITNKKIFNEWVETYGEESDFVKVRVRGEFPATGSLQFMSAEAIAKAVERKLPGGRLREHPIVLGVDVARFGDDNSVIYPRIGPDARSFPPKEFNGLKTTELTAKVIEYVGFFQDMNMTVAMIFVDEGGLGAGVVDQLDDLGYPVMGINFGNKANDAKTYKYRVDEMWGRLRDAIQRNLCLPDRKSEVGARLLDQLEQREFGYTLDGDRIRLETKKAMKERGLDSPDIADALGLTFAEEVRTIPSELMGHNGGPRMVDDFNYDPFEKEFG